MAQDPYALLEQHRAAFMDARLHAFESQLHGIVLDVNSSIAAYLQESLSITNGVVDSASGNLRVLRTLNTRIERELDRAGLRALLDAFVAEFPGQLHFIYEEIRLLQIVLPGILPSFRFKPDQFSAFQLSAVSSIETVMERAAGASMQRGMFVAAGMRFSKLLDSITSKFKAAVPDATNMAETVLSTYYRVAVGTVYELIQRARPDQEQRFQYYGPSDIKTRALCSMLLKEPPYTRAQIDLVKPVFYPVGTSWQCAGGIACRHRWRLDAKATMERAASA